MQLRYLNPEPDLEMVKAAMRSMRRRKGRRVTDWQLRMACRIVRYKMKHRYRRPAIMEVDRFDLFDCSWFMFGDMCSALRFEGINLVKPDWNTFHDVYYKIDTERALSACCALALNYSQCETLRPKRLWDTNEAAASCVDELMASIVCVEKTVYTGDD